MPGDRSNQLGSGRPFVPTLASNRPPKAPITPRLATKANVTNTTTPKLPTSSQNCTPTRVGPKQEQSTPVSALLNDNVTPRSASRKSRVDSSQSTPNSVVADTPTGIRAKSPTFGRIEGLSGFGISEAPKLAAARPKSQISSYRASPVGNGLKIQNSHGISRPASEIMDRDDSPNFFHASDAKAQTTAPRQPELKKAPTFVYADGREEGQIRTVNVPSPATSAEDKPKVPTKFFYADGSVDQAQTFPLLSPPISVSSSRSSFIGSPTQAIPPLLPHSQIQPTHPRSASPPKENIHLSYRKGVSQIIPVHASRQRTTSISAASTPVLSNQPHFDIDGTPRRRSSAASSTAARARTHTKTASMSSLDLTPRKSSNLQTSSPISPAPANSSEPSSPTDQLSSAPKPSTALSPLSSTWPRSPTKAAAMEGSPDSTENNSGSNTTLQNLNELAAKARHDRKVLDLEISNSSLLAINRSLEREIRKQKTELRRFRRLTRQSSLRNFSMASSARSTSYGGSTAEDSGVSGVGCGIDGLDLDDEDEDDEDDDFDSEDYSDDEDEGEGEGGERKKEKDAKRLWLDLSKHREILVDSQKVNQSIKRCMGFTEELISQGKRALEYKVRVSDVKLGGRVLIEDEVEGDADELGDEIGLKDHKNGENPNAENKAREMDQSLEAF